MQLQVGSTSTINCTVNNYNAGTINWLSQNESIVSNSGVLTLQPVDYSINGREFKCSLNLSHWPYRIKKVITVTVQGKKTINKLTNDLYAVHYNYSQKQQLAVSLLSTHHHMFLMVTGMLSCSVLSHWVTTLDQTTVLSTSPGLTTLPPYTTAHTLNHMRTHRPVAPSLVTWHWPIFLLLVLDCTTAVDILLEVK